MIGGKKQDGSWKIDSRFNLDELNRRIDRIARYKDRIHLSCKDAIEFLSAHRFAKKCLTYLDPPYYQAGRRLYLNAYKPNDHLSLSEYIQKLKSSWIISYDDVPEILSLYKGFRI